MSMFGGGHEIKSSTMHVEAGASVISGRGFNSRRLHSTRCARSWQASARHKRCSSNRRFSEAAEQRVECPELVEGSFMSASPSAGSFFVYIVRCADDSLYVGHSSDVASRVECHNDGRGAAWTAARRPVVLVYRETARPEAAALRC